MAVFTKFISVVNKGKLSWTLTRRCCSTRSCLFVSGKYGTGLASTVVPDLDIERDVNSQDLAENLRARKLDIKNIDLKALANGAKYLVWLDAEDERLESRRKEIGVAISELGVDCDGEVKDQLVSESREVKQALKTVSRDRWEVEDSVVIDYFQLPNRIDQNTPKDADQQIHVFGTAGAVSRSHVEMAIESNELEVSPYSSSSFYLFGRLARLELELCHRMQNFLLDEGLDMMACPDFARSVVLEGCEPTSFLHPDNFLSLAETSDLGSVRSGHGVLLTGGASLFPFVGYFVKNVITNGNVLPANYFSVGRQYVTRNAGDPFSLFRPQQSTAVQCFSVNNSSDSMKAQLDHLTKLLTTFYDNLGFHYRLVVKKASELDRAQSYKIAVEMFAPSLQSYIEVGHLALYDDFLSKRLMLKFEADGKLKNLFVLSGTAINVTKVIACIIEQTNGQLFE